MPIFPGLSQLDMLDDNYIDVGPHLQADIPTSSSFTFLVSQVHLEN